MSEGKNTQDEPKLVSDSKHGAGVIERIKSKFQTEWVWRLFVVLQVIGLVVLVYTDVTERYWSFLPKFEDTYWGQPDFGWDFVDSRFWIRRKQNWVAAVSIFGPLLLSKAVDWVVAAKNDRP